MRTKRAPGDSLSKEAKQLAGRTHKCRSASGRCISPSRTGCCSWRSPAWPSAAARSQTCCSYTWSGWCCIAGGSALKTKRAFLNLSLKKQKQWQQKDKRLWRLGSQSHHNQTVLYSMHWHDDSWNVLTVTSLQIVTSLCGRCSGELEVYDATASSTASLSYQ